MNGPVYSDAVEVVNTEIDKEKSQTERTEEQSQEEKDRRLVSRYLHELKSNHRQLDAYQRSGTIATTRAFLDVSCFTALIDTLGTKSARDKMKEFEYEADGRLTLTQALIEHVSKKDTELNEEGN